MASPEESLFNVGSILDITQFLEGEYNPPQGKRKEHLIFYPSARKKEERTKVEFTPTTNGISVRSASGNESKAKDILEIDQQGETIIFRAANGLTDSEIVLSKDGSFSFSSKPK